MDVDCSPAAIDYSLSSTPILLPHNLGDVTVQLPLATSTVRSTYSPDLSLPIPISRVSADPGHPAGDTTSLHHWDWLQLQGGPLPPPTGGSKPLDINSGKLSSQDSPTTPFSYSSRSKHRRKRIRGGDRINDGDTNGNNCVKRNKNYDIQRDISKKYILICPPSLLKSCHDPTYGP